MLVNDLSLNQDIANYDFVYFKSYYRYSEIAVAVVEYLKMKEVPFVCEELDSYISFSKLSQYARMAARNFPIPATFYAHSQSDANDWDAIAGLLEVPFICKAVDAKGGDLNYLIKSKTDLREALVRNPGVEFLYQQFIPNSFDIRVLVLDGEAKLLIKRQRTSDQTHLNNTSQGARASLMQPQELGPEAIDLAIRAAKLFKRQVAGVDIMLREGDSKPFILEVNASPQVSTGAFVEQKIKAYAGFIKQRLESLNDN